VPERVRVLALDHFSKQDRDALIDAGGDAFAWRTVPYWRFRNRANEIVPPDVLEGLEPWARPELEPQRRAFATWCRRELGRLYLEWPFDVLLLPSDAFYYVRTLPEACHELGVPAFVAQKETTITDYSLAEHAPEVQAYAPFISDRMTVCSERHKQFWVAAGSDPALIEVTGQPRFDVYARTTDHASEQGRTVLFLSYEPDAYLHEAGDRAIGWRDLRDETERVLIDATADDWNVVVKLHPLQDRAAEQAALETKAGRNPLVTLAAAYADTRELILAADVVVGFQTTALYEAMAAGKPVAYTAWGALYERFAPVLIPFEDRGDLLQVVRSPDELRSWLRDPPSVGPELREQRRAFIEEMLGPFDGRSSDRTLQVIAAEAQRWSARARTAPRRRMLDRMRRIARPLLTVGVAAQTAALRGAAKAPGRVGTSAAFRLPARIERLTALRRNGETVG
jgi:hypothetical protein